MTSSLSVRNCFTHPGDENVTAKILIGSEMGLVHQPTDLGSAREGILRVGNVPRDDEGIDPAVAEHSPDFSVR